MAQALSLTSPISHLPLVGPSFATRLEKLEIFTISDLLYHLPSRYDDFSLVVNVSSLQEGEIVTIRGKVKEMKNIFTKRGFTLQQAKVEDETGVVDVLWFNQRFLANSIKEGMEISLSGKVGRTGNKLQMESPIFEIPSQTGSLHTGRLVPIYPETAGISSKWLRSRISAALRLVSIVEYLDPDLLKREGLMALGEAFKKIHFPESLEEAARARERLAFDELLFSHLEATARKETWQKKTVGSKFEITKHQGALTKFVNNLPFSLTTAQKKVVDEIYGDLERETPMNRLLQGDVGSGKTVVAALAMLAAYLNSFQSVLMAPTEILAEQHYSTLQTLLKPLGIEVGIATGSKKDYEGYDMVVGTHALLSEKLNFKNLGLLIIDEQHRFGVNQRSKLAEKGNNPHILTMTATPIPRTVALTLYGDLDLSILDELPKKRQPITTWVVPPEKRDKAYQWIKEQKTQSFIVCPLIEESESESLQSVRSVKKEYDRLSQEVYPDLKLGLLHGRMSAKEKNTVLSEFKEGKLDILVTTPVVEVGIDIPTATIMVIEAAERFGLAQLHQLRGRVGRGEKKSYCLLFSEGNTQRLKNLERIHSGLELAEIDLRYRGPGQRFGEAQHGKWNLKVANFEDLSLVEKANEVAKEVYKDPQAFPLLHKRLKENTIHIAPN